MSKPTLKIDEGTAIYTDDLGREYTADVRVQPGDRAAVRTDCYGVRFVVEREGETVYYPMRHQGFCLDDLRPFDAWPNPFLPEEGDEA